MDYLSYPSYLKNLLFSNGMNLQDQEIGGIKGTLSGREGGPIQNFEFVGLGFSEMLKPGFQFDNISPWLLGNSEVSSMGSGSGHSNSPVESNGQVPRQIDLDGRRLHNIGQEFPKKLNVHTRTVVCKVLGCEKDLSYSKNYHKRHRVCEWHTKTSKAIVDGIEQRFCQQCSRFHVLSEFDDGRRSCRRRLLRHNERRRKNNCTIPVKLLHACQGAKFPRTRSPKRTSFLPKISLYPEQKNEHVNRCRHEELEDKLNHFPQLVTPPCVQFLPHSQFQEQSKTGIPSDAAETHASFGSPEELGRLSNSHDALSLLSTQSQLSNPLTWRYMFCNAGHGIDLQVEWNKFLQQSEILNAKHSPTPERESATDMLSSQLNRIEHQRKAMPVKMGNKDFNQFLPPYWL